MRTKAVALVIILLSVSLLAIAGPKLELSWKNPAYTGGQFKNILVLALNGNAASRAEFEDELVTAITRPGSPASPSYEFIARPNATPIDKNDLRELIKEQNIDAIVVARLTKHDVKTTYVPGEVYTPFPYYGTFYGFYDAVYPTIYAPGYMQTEKEAQLEVNWYAATPPNGQLVWTGITNTFDVGSASKAIKELVKIYSTALEKENIISPAPKK
ncbi:MAG: hypothetical protein WAK20_04360 [Candidatus Acidiferrum sp.]